MEICPNCGRDVRELDNVTGWCADCSAGVVTTERAASNLYEKTEAYLRTHADEIEFHLLNGNTLNRAIDLLHSENGKAKCLVCGNAIQRARRNSIFCRKTKECRKASRRYVYLYSEKGLSKTQALAKVLENYT